MHKRSVVLSAVLAAVCGCVAGCGGPDNDITLQGSGATFPAPLYKRWFLEYYKQHPEVRVNYTPIGSGAGIRQFTAGVVTFAGSDAGINKAQIADLPKDYGGVYALPMTAGAIVLSYNVPGFNDPQHDKPIQLSREAYVKIFLNQIDNWSDPVIARDNPGVTLPNLRITIARRADSSGTSYAFTNHMNAVANAPGDDELPALGAAAVGLFVERPNFGLAAALAPLVPTKTDAWKPGVGTSPKWGESIAAQGNDGVAALIQLTPGAIGYLEYGYAELAHLPTASLENYYHRFVVSTPETNLKALEGAVIPPDLQIKLPEPSGNPEAYPIVTYTWMLCRRQYHDAREAETLKTVLRFCLDDKQQEISEKLGYIKLPGDVAELARKRLEEIQVAP